MDTEEQKAGLKILVAEDNFVNRTLLSKIFEKLGYQATLTNNGLEAYHAFDSQFYDIVFMDIEMPQMDGYEVTKKLRERFKGEARQPVIIALTAYSMGGELENCIKQGMDDYLAKPFTMADVEKVAEKALLSK